MTGFVLWHLNVVKTEQSEAGILQTECAAARVGRCYNHAMLGRWILLRDEHSKWRTLRLERSSWRMRRHEHSSWGILWLEHARWRMRGHKHSSWEILWLEHAKWRMRRNEHSS